MLDLLRSFSFASQNVISLDSSDNWSWLGCPSYTLWTPNSSQCCGTLLPGSVRPHKALQPEHNSFTSIHFLISCMQPSSMYIHVYPLDNTGINNDPCYTFQEVWSILQIPVYIKLQHSIQLSRIARCYLFLTILFMLQFPRGQIWSSIPQYTYLQHSIQLSRITKCDRIHSIYMPYK